MNLSLLEKNLAFDFKNEDLLCQALTHRSYLNEHSQETLVSNERLEFLGDAILESIISEMLFDQFPNATEGIMTALRSRLVCTDSLAGIAKELELGSFLFLSRGEEEGGGRNNPSILANTLEAIIGAMFCDKGTEGVSPFLKKYFSSKISDLNSSNLKDHKSLLQEKAQEKEKITPTYKVVKEEGPDHAKCFTVGVYLAKRELSQGQGYSKQEAEEDAARIALENYQ